MSKRLSALAYRRGMLVQRINEQRMEMTELVQQWHKPLAVADSGLKVIRVLRSHPAWLASGLTALLAWRFKKAAGPNPTGGPLAYLYPTAIFAATRLIAGLTERRKTKSDEAGNDPQNR